MFKKSNPSHGDLFRGISNQVSGRKRQALEDPSGWHNVSHDHVTSRIDESVFSVLYSDGIGRPNAPVRVLVAMMILKEGNGWSDEQLFEECRFHLKVMRALGLQNLNEDVPTESTYYDFRRSLVEHAANQGEDLMKACFRQITAEQVSFYNVSGSKVRMDSKLVNSNLAAFNRLELILEVVRVFIRPLALAPLQGVLGEEDLDLLTRLKKESVANVTYRLPASREKEMIQALGYLIQQLLQFYQDQSVDKYEILHRLWTEQYTVSDPEQEDDHLPEVPVPRDPKELSSSSLQSPHDAEATFRSKGRGRQKKRVAGYHMNVTETCHEDDPVNLIVDVDVQPANVSECDFLIPSLKASEELLQEAAGCTASEGPIIEHASTDGGFDSIDNRIAMSQPGSPHWNRSKPKGQPVLFFSLDENNQPQARVRETGQNCEVTWLERAGKYRVRYPDKRQNRYFTLDQIQGFLLFQQIQAQQRPEDKSIRANVEATIYHVFHRLQKRDKIKYRGWYRSQCYALSRALWVNFRRISQKTLADSLFFDLLKLWRVQMNQHLAMSSFQRTFFVSPLLFAHPM